MPAGYREHLARRDRASLRLRSGDLTWRGFLVGGLLSFFLATGAPYANMVLTDYVSADFDTRGAILLFFLLIGGLNLLFKLAGRGMGSCPVPGRGNRGGLGVGVPAFRRSRSLLPRLPLQQPAGDRFSGQCSWRLLGAGASPSTAPS